MEAGRELDAEVAEKVMLLKVIARDWPCWYDPETGYAEAVVMPLEDGDLEGTHPEPVYDPYPGCNPNPRPSVVPEYSTDIAAAWAIVEELKLSILYEPDGWMASYVGSKGAPHIHYIHAATAPLAICLAALECVK